MAGLAHVTRAAVLDAIARADDMGLGTFLRAHGFAPGTYQLRHNGRSYPSKAVLGVAAGLGPSEFFGGVAQVVPALRRLGFEVRVGVRVVTEVATVALAREHALDVPELATSAASYFHSGSNRPGEIRGLAAVGADIGVVAGEVNTSAESRRALLDLAGTDINVFVDSGAFSEVDRDLNVVRPMGGAAWAKVLNLYLVLARALGSQLYVVAPDRVGDQGHTLSLLRVYAPELRDLHELGARVLVPVQRGTMPLAAFYEAACTVLGFRALPALPCRKGATTVAEVEAFVREARPAHVHMLGLGPTNKRARAYEAALGGTSFSLDSCWLAANAGRQDRGRPYLRTYTRARDIAKAVCPSTTTGVVTALAIIIAKGSAGLLGG